MCTTARKEKRKAYGRLFCNSKIWFAFVWRKLTHWIDKMKWHSIFYVTSRHHCKMTARYLRYADCYIYFEDYRNVIHNINTSVIWIFSETEMIEQLKASTKKSKSLPFQNGGIRSDNEVSSRKKWSKINKIRVSQQQRVSTPLVKFNVIVFVLML